MHTFVSICIHLHPFVYNCSIHLYITVVYIWMHLEIFGYTVHVFGNFWIHFCDTSRNNNDSPHPRGLWLIWLMFCLLQSRTLGNQILSFQSIQNKLRRYWDKGCESRLKIVIATWFSFEKSSVFLLLNLWIKSWPRWGSVVGTSWSSLSS